MGIFTINATELEWIGGPEDDPKDLCLHGHAEARIGERTVEFHATVSATALYLLKTLTEDHIINEDNQMLPCCGHFMIPNEARDNVVIIGCNRGVDWSVIHEGDNVRIVLEDGYEETVAPDDYKAEVFRFADAIEAYYASCKRKRPADKFSRTAYKAFWNEWHRRRGPRPKKGGGMK